MDRAISDASIIVAIGQVQVVVPVCPDDIKHVVDPQPFPGVTAVRAVNAIVLAGRLWRTVYLATAIATGGGHRDVSFPTIRYFYGPKLPKESSVKRWVEWFRHGSSFRVLEWLKWLVVYNVFAVSVTRLPRLPWVS